jgi:hypothetical protein
LAALGRSGGRVAVSVLADRLFSLFAVLFISLAFSLFYWRQMQQVPAIAALGTSIVVAAVAFVAGACLLFAASDLTRPIEARLLRWATLANLLVQARGMILMLRTNPLSLLAAFVLALPTQILTVFAGVRRGRARWSDQDRRAQPGRLYVCRTAHPDCERASADA